MAATVIIGGKKYRNDANTQRYIARGAGGQTVQVGGRTLRADANTARYIGGHASAYAAPAPRVGGIASFVGRVTGQGPYVLSPFGVRATNVGTSPVFPRVNLPNPFTPRVTAPTSMVPSYAVGVPARQVAPSYALGIRNTAAAASYAHSNPHVTQNHRTVNVVAHVPGNPGVLGGVPVRLPPMGTVQTGARTTGTHTPTPKGAPAPSHTGGVLSGAWSSVQAALNPGGGGGVPKKTITLPNGQTVRNDPYNYAYAQALANGATPAQAKAEAKKKAAVVAAVAGTGAAVAGSPLGPAIGRNIGNTAGNIVKGTTGGFPWWLILLLGLAVVEGVSHA